MAQANSGRTPAKLLGVASEPSLLHPPLKTLKRKHMCVVELLKNRKKLVENLETLSYICYLNVSAGK